jgi:hypothetical protein
MGFREERLEAALGRVQAPRVLWNLPLILFKVLAL